MEPSHLPRGAGLFSATQTEAVQALARAGLRNQVRVNVAVGPVPSTSGRGSNDARSGAADDRRTPAGLTAAYLTCESNAKLAQLLHFLQARGWGRPLLFTCSALRSTSSLPGPRVWLQAEEGCR